VNRFRGQAPHRPSRAVRNHQTLCSSTGRFHLRQRQPHLHPQAQAPRRRATVRHRHRIALRRRRRAPPHSSELVHGLSVEFLLFCLAFSVFSVTSVLNPFSRFVPAPAAGCSFVQFHEAKQFQLPPRRRASSPPTLESVQTMRASIPSPSYRRSFDSGMKLPALCARSERKIGGE